MPIVHVEMWPGRTQAVKAELARALTDAMVNIAKTPPEAVLIVFDVVPKESWAQGGVLASEAS